MGFNVAQQQALDAKGSVLVSASAGSGKTTVIIEKILRLILGGADVRRMCVMTFSRAAAAEMKNRLIKGLYEQARGADPDPHIYNQLEAFPFSNICTIDSFCYGLTKKYFAAVGADPSAKPLDTEEGKLILEECIDRACEEFLSAGNTDFLSYAERYTTARRMDNIKEHIAKLRDFLSVQPDADTLELMPDIKRAETYFLREFRARAERVRAEAMSAAQALHQADMKEEIKALDMASGAERLANSVTCAEFFAESKNLASYSVSRRTKNIDVNAMSMYNETVKSYTELCDKTAEYGAHYRNISANLTGEKDCRVLLAVAKRVEELYSARKKRDGKLDFADMSAFALKLLDIPEIREEVRASFDYVFIDEYQDTNYVQEHLLCGISDGSNIFAVGDIKQAIYHFRYAEPKIFKARMTAYADGAGQNIALNENYRSRKDILDFVNLCCGEVMTEALCGIDYRHGNMMTAGADYRDEGAAVEVYICGEKPKDNGRTPIYSVKEAKCEADDDRESRFVAEYINGLVGKQRVYRAKKKLSEDIAYGDIAVLCRRRAECALIARRLEEYGIPYSVGDADEGLYAPRELLVDFLRLTVSTHDVDVINVLSCPMFDFTPAELVDIRISAPKVSIWEALNAYSDKEELVNKIKKFTDYVAKLRLYAAALPVSEILTKVLNDGLGGYFLSIGASGRIYKFLDTVKTMDSNFDLRDFLDFYDSSYKGEKPPAVNDSVTVMTMHKSKGLEFPVVIIPYTDSKSVGISTSKATLFMDRELGLALKSSDTETGVGGDNFFTATQKLKSTEEERQELARLMYVAFTRAENRLVITAASTGNPYNRNSIADLIYYAAKHNPLILEYIHTGVIAESEHIEKKIKESLPAEFGYLTEGYRYERATTLPAKQSVSEILAREHGVVTPYHSTRASGAESGTAYHLVMQRIALDADVTDIARLIEDLTAAGEISSEVAKGLDVEKIATLLNSEVMDAARRGVVYRELPFLRQRLSDGDAVLVQGVIDLVIDEGDGLIVVDYKASGLDAAFLADRYRRQLELYAEAAGAIFGKNVKKRILFNILKNYTVEI